MRGRPKSTLVSVRPDNVTGGFRVEVPPSLNSGKRMRRFFSDEKSADIFAAECQLAFARDGQVISEAPVSEGITIRSAVARYLKDKEPEVCKDHLKMARNHLGKLVKKFGHLPPDDIAPLSCRDWIRSLPLAQRTRHGVFSSCRTFYRWAIRYDYAQKNPLDKMEPIPKGESPRAILSPAQMRKLLKTKMPGCVRAWLVLGGFCGLRPIEVYRLDWSAVDLATKEIHVGGDVIKRDALRGRGMRERYVTIPDNALALLRPAKGPVVPMTKGAFQREVAKLSKKLGLSAWPHDCLRHSAASYMLAKCGDAGIVAAWLGHTTTRMVYEAYARAVPKAQGEEWYAIR